MFKNILNAAIISMLFISVASAGNSQLTIKRDASVLNRDASIYLVVNGQMITKPLYRGQEITISVPSTTPVKIEYAAYVKHNLATRHSTDKSSLDIIHGTTIDVTQDTTVNISPTHSGFIFE